MNQLNYIIILAAFLVSFHGAMGQWNVPEPSTTAPVRPAPAAPPKHKAVIAHEPFTTAQQHFYDSIPAKQKGLNDFEHIFTSDQKKHIDSICNFLWRKTTLELTVITLGDSQTPKTYFNQMVLRVAHVWSSRSIDKPTGLVVGISKTHQLIWVQRSVGMAKIISSEETDDIIKNQFKAEFEKGNFYAGAANGVGALVNKIYGKLTHH